MVGAGVIDRDYTGTVKVVLFNLADQKFEVKVGDRIAQLIIERVAILSLQVVQGLNPTVRGDRGFGSSGI